MNPQQFIHPLSTIEKIDTDEGQKQVMNNWAFASMIWTGAVAGNINAIGIATELFTNKDEIPSFLEASKAENEGAIATAIAILAFAIDDKLELEQAFENKSSEN